MAPPAPPLGAAYVCGNHPTLKTDVTEGSCLIIQGRGTSLNIPEWYKFTS